MQIGLDENSLCKSKGKKDLLTWDVVLRRVLQFVLLESEFLKNAKKLQDVTILKRKKVSTCLEYAMWSV